MAKRKTLTCEVPASTHARHLISMGLEVDWDSADEAHGTLASGAVLELISGIDPDLGLLEVLASLEHAADGAAEMHCDDPADAGSVAALKRFAAHINAARKEIA